MIAMLANKPWEQTFEDNCYRVYQKQTQVMLPVEDSKSMSSNIVLLAVNQFFANDIKSLKIKMYSQMIVRSSFMVMAILQQSISF